jgi:hypothetical protein
MILEVAAMMAAVMVRFMLEVPAPVPMLAAFAMMMPAASGRGRKRRSNHDRGGSAQHGCGDGR